MLRRKCLIISVSLCNVVVVFIVSVTLLQSDDLQHVFISSPPRNMITRVDHHATHSYDWLYGEKYRSALDRASKVKKRIVFWHPDKDLSMTLEDNLTKECGSCELSADKKLIEDEGTHAVIFLCEDMMSDRLPKKRNLNQYWVWRSAEAVPYLMYGNWIKYCDKVKFNLTLNFRRDADITLNYGDAYKMFQNPLSKDALRHKKYLALIAVSNCGLTPGATLRMQYVRELLRLGFNLTTMGSCFSGQTIPKDNHNEMSMHASQFKFYFSFENAYHCRDYVTEKFFRPLFAETVPVVWGSKREDYEAYVPSSAFIHIDDFSSMQSLVDYLNYLDKNDTAYLEYFKWRTEYPKPANYRKKKSFCQLCHFLNGINVNDAYKVNFKQLARNETFIYNEPKERTMPSVYDWYVGTENQECLAQSLSLDEQGRVIVEKYKPVRWKWMAVCCFVLFSINAFGVHIFIKGRKKCLVS